VHLDGTPPGYCDAKLRRKGVCKTPRHDDWAVISTLELEDGTQLRAFPCKKTACKEARARGLRSWIDLEGRVHEIPARDIESRSDTWYVSFPPGPAAVFLPFVALFGVELLDVLLTVLFAALTPLLLLRALDRVRGECLETHYWGAVAWLVATPFLFVASHGNVWFTAQVLGCLFLLGYLGSAVEAEEPLRAGLCLALAMACRPHLAFAFIWFVHEWRRTASPLSTLLRFAAPVAAIGVMMAGYNYVRFGDIFEFGHRFLDIRWQTRMQEHGQFSLEYLSRNLRCAFWLWPQAQPAFPFFKVSLHGSALWLGAPWLILISAGGRELFRGRKSVLWICALIVALPALVYHNSGQRQFSYRFALDWLPFVLMAMALQGLLARRAFRALVLVGALYEGVGAWNFEAAEGVELLGRTIFVVDPLGWPFQDEFN
jgi:hypothetical protein